VFGTRFGKSSRQALTDVHRALRELSLSPPGPPGGSKPIDTIMKIRNSLKSLKTRHRDCRVIRRRGRVYVINKTNRRFKARQG